MSWEYKTLDQLGEVSRGRSKHRPRNDPSLFGGKYPFIQTADVKAANFYITEYDTTYNEKGLAQSRLWNPGTLCITIAANIADTGILAMDACFPDSVMGFLPYEGIADVRFVKYCFDILQQNCKKISQGAAQDNLSWEKLSTILFPAPPIEVQTKIADILSTYDNLIENNKKQIKLLEEAAQRLYKEWFIDLRFPGHEITPIVDGVPEGWAWGTLADIAVFRRGKTITKDQVKAGIIPVVAGGLEPAYYHDTPNTNVPVVTVSGSGANAGFTRMYHTKVWASDCSYIDAAVTKNTAWVYCFLKGNKASIDAMQKGAAQPHVYAKDLNAMKALFPDDKLLEQFRVIADPMFTRIGKLDMQIKRLAEARDRLLPKLMSGEIEV